ncbi:MAG: hypothetical protein WCT12_34080, partial [Verrucomicrobiota bacterium]
SGFLVPSEAPADQKTDETSNEEIDSGGDTDGMDEARLMVRNNEGLTKTYNRFHDPEETAPDILRLRDLHAAMDRAAAGKKKPNNSRAKTPFTAPAQGEIIPGPQTDLFA